MSLAMVYWWLPSTMRLSVNGGAATNNNSSPPSKEWRENRMESRFWSFGGKQKARAPALRGVGTKIIRAHLLHRQKIISKEEKNVRLWDRGRRKTRTGAEL